MVQPNWDGFYNLRIGLTIYPAHEKAMEVVMDELYQRCPAQFVLLLDSSGQIVALKGERGSIDLVALAALVAGDLAASQEIARLTGQYRSYQLVLREGVKVVSFIAEAGHSLALFVQVSSEVPLGWARLLIRQASQQLERIVTVQPEQVESLEIALGDEHLADIVDDALDAMWTD